jgi:putative glutamine amidotransferase
MKKVLLTQRIIEAENYPETRAGLALDWAELFATLPAVPLAVPYGFPTVDFLNETRPDALILTGGNDLSVIDDSPANRRRDALETEILELAIERNLPVLAVCRGFQFIAARFGLTPVAIEAHIGKTHAVNVDPAASASRYFEILKRLTAVNSFHRYGIPEAPSAARALVRASDGTVEAFEHDKQRILALAWHPERQGPSQNIDRELITTHLELS